MLSPQCAVLFLNHPSVHRILYREFILHTIQLLYMWGRISSQYVLQIRDFMGVPGLSTLLIGRCILSKVFLKCYANSPPRVASTNITNWYFLLSYHELVLSSWYMSCYSRIYTCLESRSQLHHSPLTAVSARITRHSFVGASNVQCNLFGEELRLCFERERHQDRCI